MRFDPVEFACFDQRRDDRPNFRPCVVTSEEGVFTVEGNGADGSLDGVVVEFDPIFEVVLVFRPVCSLAKVDQGFISGC
mgnify:CR=1 FL=1